MGGDCLNYGCVPSKAILAAARTAARVRDAGDVGITTSRPAIDFAAVMERMRRIRAGIAVHDSAARLAAQGVDVFLGEARFVAADQIAVGGHRLRFARSIIASGARAAVPPIPGLATVRHFTNETIFSLTQLPARLCVIGAGPIGCELAQAFQRFGSSVTILSRDRQSLPREDADASAVVQRALERDGVSIETGASVISVHQDGQEGIVVTYEIDGQRHTSTADEILVAVGRAPNVEDLDLAAAGINSDGHGVAVDDFLRTSNRRVYAAGDICSRFKFTHAADAMARIAIQNALFFGRRKVSALVIPWATYTDPEIAHVGIHEADAKPRGSEVVSLTTALTDVDRAVLDGETDGFGRVHVDRRTGRILGATLVASHAGELIGEMALAMTARLPIGAVSRTVHPYPTQAEVWKKLGDAWNRGRLTPRVRRLLSTVLEWRR
jgi:pyruvate/2-oxoglutarate dehydrogenase complex dihydrolipoamide dehydrogenase (E3) component